MIFVLYFYDLKISVISFVLISIDMVGGIFTISELRLKNPFYYLDIYPHDLVSNTVGVICASQFCRYYNINTRRVPNPSYSIIHT